MWQLCFCNFSSCPPIGVIHPEDLAAIFLELENRSSVIVQSRNIFDMHKKNNIQFPSFIFYLYFLYLLRPKYWQWSVQPLHHSTDSEKVRTGRWSDPSSSREFDVCWGGGLHPSRVHVSHCWPVLDLSWRSRSSSWGFSVFACHWMGCGGVRNEQFCIVEVLQLQTDEKKDARTHTIG